MDDWVQQTLQSLGYFGIALLTLLETVFPPIPSELVLPLGGYLVAQGRLTLVGAIVAGTLGAMAGALLLYWLGSRYGEDRLKDFARRHGRWLTLSPRDVDRVTQWFDRHGAWAVFGCRMVPGLRSLISIPAGVHRMPLVPFITASLLGTLVWTAALVYLGKLAGDHFERIGEYLGTGTKFVVGALVLAYVVRVLRYRPDAD